MFLAPKTVVDAKTEFQPEFGTNLLLAPYFAPKSFSRAKDFLGQTNVGAKQVFGAKGFFGTRIVLAPKKTFGAKRRR